MNHENSQKLYNDFPDLYRGKTKPITKSLMSFGFECGDGWFELIYNLSRDITVYCIKENIKMPEVIQVKEKFGSLRFYIQFGDDNISRMIRDAEQLSSKICEVCGENGDTKAINFWYSTLCKKHIELKTRRGIIKRVED